MTTLMVIAVVLFVLYGLIASTEKKAYPTPACDDRRKNDRTSFTFLKNYHNKKEVSI